MTVRAWSQAVSQLLNQPSLFDQPDADAAARARDDGIGRAARAVTDSWRGEARAAIMHCAMTLPDFTSDDVLEELAHRRVAMPAVLSALGPVMLDAAKAGTIVKTERRRQTRFKHRHRELTVWERAKWSKS